MTNGPRRVFSKVCSVGGEPVTINLIVPIQKEFIEEEPVIVPHQTRNALENVLIEMRIAGVFRNDTQDRHQTVENVFVSGRQGLPGSDDDSHNTFERHQYCKQIVELNKKPNISLNDRSQPLFLEFARTRSSLRWHRSGRERNRGCQPAQIWLNSRVSDIDRK